MRRSLPDLELLVTCEHGGNQLPTEYLELFAGAEDLLASHRGFDAGALDVARAIARRYGARLVYSETSRLLVDLNRSTSHPRLYSERSRSLSANEKHSMLARHYSPYRAEVEDAVAAAARAGKVVLHVSSHSFSPILDGIERQADVGLLFDPRRTSEARWAAAWRDKLRAAAPHWRVRRNYPYRGTSDGLTTHLRKRFSDAHYAGIELEVNQRLVGQSDWHRSIALLAATVPVPGAEPPVLARPRPDR